jgi:transcription termination factor Rho
MIVAQPKTIKTMLLKIANAIANHPEVYLLFLLIDERRRKLQICNVACVEVLLL